MTLAELQEWTPLCQSEYLITNLGHWIKYYTWWPVTINSLQIFLPIADLESAALLWCTIADMIAELLLCCWFMKTWRGGIPVATIPVCSQDILEGVRTKELRLTWAPDLQQRPRKMGWPEGRFSPIHCASRTTAATRYGITDWKSSG